MYDHKNATVYRSHIIAPAKPYEDKLFGNGHELFTLIVKKYVADSMKILPFQSIVELYPKTDVIIGEPTTVRTTRDHIVSQ